MRRRPLATPARRIPRWRLAAALLAVAGVGVALWGFGRRPLVRRDPDLSVLLVTIDTLRADALGCYGRAGAATPWIDRLAAEGVRFDRAHAHNVVTLPSHANLLSGQYPFRHGVRDNSGFRLPAGTPTLATLLKANGWRTAAFVSAFPLDSRFGLDAGFEVYDDRLGGAETRTSFLVPERRGTATVDAAVRWLAGHRGERTFCFVHLYEPHFPYDPPQPFASRFSGEPYRGEVAAADAALEPLLRPLLDAGEAGRTLVVLTGDHGEALGEHGEATHGIFAYEATLRVPLILYAPRILPPRVVRAPVRHVDVLPTVLDILGVKAAGNLPGSSLAPLIAGWSLPPSTLYFESLSASLNQGWAPLRGVVEEDLKYVDLPIPELYDLAADPAEAKNLATARAADVERLRGLLAGIRKDEQQVSRGAEDASARERLRALGYVAGSGPAVVKERYTDEDDPKRLIDLDARASEVLRLYDAGDLPAALAVCRETIRRRPDMPTAYLHLAFLERARGDLNAAVEALRHAVALRPMDTENVALLGVYLNEAGRARETADLLEPYAKAPQPDLDVLTARGIALAALGRGEEALVSFEAARRVDPSNPMALVNIGTVHLMAGETDRARRAFEEALDTDPGLARAHNSLGVIAAREGRLDDAVKSWTRAAELDPTDYQTLFNLGTTLRRLGRGAEARHYLEAYLRVAPVAVEARDIARVRAWLAEPGTRGGGR
ncbi:MAG TPA: sulfatase-like hydrolase/transferase [Vicinamibacteria bacterium]